MDGIHNSTSGCKIDLVFAFKHHYKVSLVFLISVTCYLNGCACLSSGVVARTQSGCARISIGFVSPFFLISFSSDSDWHSGEASCQLEINNS